MTTMTIFPAVMETPCACHHQVQYLNNSDKFVYAKIFSLTLQPANDGTSKTYHLDDLNVCKYLMLVLKI